MLPTIWISIFAPGTRKKTILPAGTLPWLPGGNTEGVVDFPSAGDYYLEVVDGRSDNSSSDPYSLNLTFKPSVDPYEPNNTYGSAAKVNANQSWKSTLLPKGDSDWFRFTVEQHGELTIQATNVPENLDVNFRVWNAQKNYISSWFSPLAKGGSTEAVFDLPAPGAYVVEMRDGRDDERSIQPIDVQFSFIPSVDAHEPNNAFGKASSIAPGQSISATILPKGDSDWYQLEVDEQGELKVAVTGTPPELDIVYRLWRQQQKLYYQLVFASRGGWREPQ